MFLGLFGRREGAFLEITTGFMSPGQSHVTLRSRDFVVAAMPQHQRRLRFNVVPGPTNHLKQRPPQRDRHNMTATTITTTTTTTTTKMTMTGRPATRKTGPNDASSVVWVICKFFFPLFRALLSLNTIFRCFLCFEGTGWLMEGGDVENGPKRRKSRRLGHS
jgi:hypothetical protein